MPNLQTALRKARRAYATYAELHARRELLRRPWEEDFLHWSNTPTGWQLHGHIPPPPGRLRGATPSGWCTALHHADRR
jgi:hypothetical protein